MATLLSCFDILPTKDEFGKDIVPPEEMALGTIVFVIRPPRLQYSDSILQCSQAIPVLHTATYSS